MLHKKLIYIVLIVSFIACSSKNPGMNKDEIVRTLDEQAMQHETAVKAASAAMPGSYGRLYTSCRNKISS